MNRRSDMAWILGASLAVAAAGLAAAPLGGSQTTTAPAQDPAPVFRAGADLVTVEASVRRDRRAVVGLTAADFELLDNGVAQEISDVTYEKLPIDVTVVLDVSSSVTGPTPISRPSIARTGATSVAVPTMKTSSAR